jgi:hypothetical protein
VPTMSPIDFVRERERERERERPQTLWWLFLSFAFFQGLCVRSFASNLAKLAATLKAAQVR